MTRPLQAWVQNQRGRYLLRRGLNLMQQGNHRAAIEAFTVALDKHATPAEVYLQRGTAYLQQTNLEAALADFNQAIVQQPTAAPAYGYRALVRYQQGDLSGALADWALALQYQPRDATLRYNRGLVWAQQEHYEAALADLDLALEINPLLAEAYLHRGKVKQHLGDLVGAVKDWELALCNDLRLEEAHQLLVQVRQHSEENTLSQLFADLLPDDFSLAVEQRGSLLVLSLHRPVGAPVNYFKLPDHLRERLMAHPLPEVRRFRLIARAGESSLAEWDQTYGVYDKAPCPPARWRDALATTLLLFPPLGILALVYAAQVKPAYQRGDYPIAARASQTVRKLFLSSGAIMGLMLFGLASYGVYTHVDTEYPNSTAKTAPTQEHRPPEDML